MEVKAMFVVEGSFKLTGHGLVIYGDILEGTISREDFILFDVGETEMKLKIKDINFLDRISEKIAKVGLTFHYDSAEKQASLETSKVERQAAKIVGE
jgi:selenocysteine-specific translation elongation factor